MNGKKVIRTVCGDLDASNWGPTNCHAHLELDICQHHFDSRYDHYRLRYEETEPEVKDFGNAGGFALCEVTPMGFGRSPVRLRQISERTGVAIVMGTGIYHEMFHPFEILKLNRDELCELMVREFRDGVGSTGVRAGVIGEQGTYEGQISPREREVFLASADAARETGLAISTHTHAGVLAVEQAELLLEAGVEPHKIIIGHMDDRSPLAEQINLFRDVLKLGVFLQFDDIGFSYYSPTLNVQMPTDQERALILADLIQEGFLGQLVLGIDVCQARHLAAQGGPGFAYLVKDFVEIAGVLGVDEVAMNRMLVENPAKALSFEVAA